MWPTKEIACSWLVAGAGDSGCVACLSDVAYNSFSCGAQKHFACLDINGNKTIVEMTTVKPTNLRNSGNTAIKILLALTIFWRALEKLAFLSTHLIL